MPQQREETKIFLCHASEDKAKVTEIYYKLKALGFNPWLDKEDLLPGQFWADEIPEVIKSSALILVFFSKISVFKRGYVQKEFKLALNVLDEIPAGKIFIIPIRLNECEIPQRFKHINYCDFFEEDGFEKIVESIKYAMELKLTTPDNLDLALSRLDDLIKQAEEKRELFIDTETEIKHKVLFDHTDEEILKFIKYIEKNRIQIGGMKRYSQKSGYLVMYGKSVEFVNHCIIGKRAIVNCEISFISEIIDNLILDTKQTQKIRKLFGFIIHGYEEGKPALWDIPEVRTWFYALNKKYPYLLFWLHPEDIMSFVSMFGESSYISSGYSKLNYSSIVDFVEKACNAGNKVCLKLSEKGSQSEKEMISEALGRIKSVII